MLSTLAAWLVAEGIVIYAPDMIQAVGKYTVAGLASVGLLSGLAGALGGASTAGGVGASGVKSADMVAHDERQIDGDSHSNIDSEKAGDRDDGNATYCVEVDNRTDSKI